MSIELESQDQRARTAALDITRSFLMQAPAGSGKTTVLTCRLLALLAQADSPEEVLAITFTRKAAAEMRERVMQALQQSAAGLPGRVLEAPLAAAVLRRDRAGDWRLLENPARLRIQTIDAFCQSLASQLPVAARAGLQWQVAVPATPLYVAAARRVLERALSEQQLRAHTQLLFARLDNNWQRLEELLAEMLAERAHWLPRVLGVQEPDLGARVSASLRSLIDDQLRQTVELIPLALRVQGAELSRHAAGRLLAAGASDARLPELAGAGATLGAEHQHLPYWQFMCELALTRDGEWRRSWNKKQGIPAEDKRLKPALQAWVVALAGLAGVQELLRELLALPEPTIPAEDTAALAALSVLLRQAAAELQLEFAQQGQVDYAAVAAAARSALTENGEPTDLALRCGGAIRHLLIDEFQDTSFEQFELLRALVAGWEAGDGRTLFAVGDPMQSIYQFREAEVGLFLRARDEGIGALKLGMLQLRRNFRSAPEVIAWVNEHCAAIFPVADDARLAAIRYLPALSAISDRHGFVSLHAFASNDPQLEAARIVQIVRSARERKADATVAVLVAARRHAAPIAAALQGAGIAVRGVRLEALRERTAVRDLCALARALQHPADRTAWLTLLHGPCCGLNLSELQQLCEDQAEPVAQLVGSAAHAARLEPQARTRLARVHAALLPVLEGAERSLPLWQRVDHAWLRLGGPAACADERDLADAQAFLQFLSQQRDAEWLAGDAFDHFAEALYASAPAAPGAVEILTMHGAKGLEWDVVIVPGLARSPNSEGDSLLQWVELPAAGGGTELLLAPINDAALPRERSVATYIRRVRLQRLRLERARLLYVAATRARQELHWLGAAIPDAQGELRPRGGTALALLWPAIGAQFAAQLAAAGAASDPAPALKSMPAPPAARVQRLAADWRPTGLPAVLHVEQLDLSLREPGTRPEYSWVGLAARAVGTIVHAELQRLAELAVLPAGPDIAADDYLVWLAELGVATPDRAAARDRIVSALARTLSDPRGRWLLHGSREARSELRLTGLHESRVINIIIDRLIVDEHGDRWIVEYKTSSHEGGDLDGFLAQEAQRYGPQLQRYAELVRQHGAGRTRAALYFPLLGEFRELALRS
ncbi:MAG: UvrD-helicase domain-containing protein [Steroidobacteraceae bacterium]